MYSIQKTFWKILYKEWDTTIEISEDDLEKLNMWYIYDNVSLAFIQTEESIQNNILKIKEQCWKDIYSKYSVTQQSNLTARIAEINMLCLLESRQPSSEEMLDILAWKEMIEWIRWMRNKCTSDINVILWN